MEKGNNAYAFENPWRFSHAVLMLMVQYTEGTSFAQKHHILVMF